MCQCGCRGWCSLYPILLLLSWDLAALASGSARVCDQFGHTLAKIIPSCAFVVVILEIRADWPAWAELAGIRIWAHGDYPCPKCDLSLQTISNAGYVAFVKLTSVPWASYGHNEYLRDIKRHSIESYSVFMYFCLVCFSFVFFGGHL
jgi:hypothetical protein